MVDGYILLSRCALQITIQSSVFRVPERANARLSRYFKFSRLDLLISPTELPPPTVLKTGRILDDRVFARAVRRERNTKIEMIMASI